MRRRILITLMFLLIGAVVNVIVAWSGQWLAARTWSTDRDSPCAEEVQRPLRTQWFGAVPVDWPPPDEQFVGMRWLDEEWHLSNGMGSISPPNTLINAGYPVVSEAYFAAGWPFRSLHWWADVDNRPLRTGGANIIVYEGGIAWPDWLHGHAGGGSFALKPIWFGFVGDSLFYAALFAAIYFGVRHLVRAIRVYRRLCPTCKYPIGTSPLCTECGEPLPTPRIQ